jgi:hypothetical protein
VTRLSGGVGRLLLILAGVAVLLVGLYWAAGTWLAPKLIADAAQDWTRTNLKQELALGEIKVDPFALTVDISDIAIPAKAPMVSVKRLVVDADFRSLFAESYRLDSVVVTEPRVNAIVGEDGKLNLLALVPPPNPDPFPPVLVADLKVAGGEAYLADHSRAGKPDTLLAPIGFELKDLHTTRDEGGGFKLDAMSDKGEALAFRGKLSMAPIASSGGLAIRNLQASSVQEFAGDMLPVPLKGGRIDLDMSYRGSYGAEGAAFAVKLPKLTLSALDLGGTPRLLNADVATGTLALTGIEAEGRMPAGGELSTTASVGGIAARDLVLTGTGRARGEKVALKSADLEGIRYGGAGDLSIAAIRLAGLDTTTNRTPDGAFSIMRLMSDAPPAAGEATPPPSVGEFSLTDARIRVVDFAVTPHANWVVTPLTVTARGKGGNIASGPLDVSVDGRLNGKTSFAASGEVNAGTPSADLNVRMANFPVAAAVPYSIDFPALQIVKGTVGAEGRVRYSPKAMGYTGSAAIDDLELIETYRKSDLVAWKRLALTGIDATPKRVTVARAELVRPYTDVIILQDGTLNFQRLVTMNPSPVVTPAADVPPPKLTRAEKRALAKRLAAEKQAAAAEARAALAAPIVEPDIPVRVARLDIRGGTLAFADFSLNPNFAARVEGVSGTVSGISNSPRDVATMKLAGYVIDKYSPVTIEGEMNLLQFDRRTDVDMAFRNIELPVFNPYSGRFAGYSIAKGKLTTELGYTIDNRKLEASHHIVIDQLEWGEATDSKEKVSLPIKFATSLLKDKNGVIDLDVPVSGTLDDPDFSIGPIVWKIIGNLIEKVLTAPFRALGDLFGGKDDVQFVDFAAGSAEVPSEATSNLAGIAKGLSEKPELRLDIPSGPGLPIDATALADRKIAAAAMAKEAKKGQPTDLMALELDERHDRLEDLYRARMKAKPDYGERPEDEAKDARRQREVDWLMAELRKSFEPTPDELAALGKARATAVRDRLLEGGTPVDPARLFLSGRDSAAEKDGKARMELKLEGG